MANQVLMPPETDAEIQAEGRTPAVLKPSGTELELWKDIGHEDSFWSSLTSSFREAFAKPEIDPTLTSKPVDVDDPLAEVPVWRSLADNLRDSFFPKKLPPLELTSKPIAVVDRMATRMSPASLALSVAFYAVILGLLIWITIYMSKLPQVAKVVEPVSTPIDLKPYIPVAPVMKKAMGGGGGGGDQSIIPAAKGKLPKFDKNPIVPPTEVIKNDHPKLAVDPAVAILQPMKLDNNMPNLGDPTAKVGLASNGSGQGGGIGSGKGGGVGSGRGNGVGPGSGGNYGGGLMNVGGGVSAPQVIFKVDPEFSDEARKAKYQGLVTVQVIVDTNGIPRNPKVVSALGMGLDEKAIEAVLQYRFKPAMFQGKPVPVAINMEIDFHIY